MEKKGKITLSIVIAVVAVLAIVIATLCLIVTKPLEGLTGYKYAVVYTSSSDATGHYMSAETNANDNGKFKNLLASSSYSVMQSILSGRTNLENEYYYVDGDVVELGKDEIVDGKGLYESEYADASCAKVKLVFDGVKTAVIGKSEYEFDTVEFLVPNTSGEIRIVHAVAYKASVYENTNAENEYEAFAVFNFKANTTDLYNFIVALD